MSAGIHPCAGLLAAGARLIAGARVRGSRPPLDHTPRVYFANHSSHLDFVVLWWSLPRGLRERTKPVAAQEYWESTPLRSYVATRLFQAVLVRRTSEPALGARAMLSPLLEELDRGDSLVIFPEGTRGDGADIGEFRPGLYQICRQRPQTEAVPVYLDNLHKVLPKGEFLPLPLESSVTFGAPLRLAPGEDERSFLDRARDALRALRRR
jgi:1-acyl-sn-glycerol-3-phosphate acyltransferase